MFLFVAVKVVVVSVLVLLWWLLLLGLLLLFLAGSASALASAHSPTFITVTSFRSRNENGGLLGISGSASRAVVAKIKTSKLQNHF